MRLLMVTCDKLLSGSLRIALKAEGLRAQVCERGEEGIDLARRYDYDAIVLDAVLPDTDGKAVIRALRLADVRTAIILLSGRADLALCVDALNLGADDCLVRPVHKAELIARIRSAVRRTHAQAHSTIRVGNLEIDLNTKEVSVFGNPVHLTVTEYRMLEFLALRRGMIVNKNAMFERLYDGTDEPEIKIINVFISKLRKKLATANRGESYIATVWGGGYRLRDPASSRKAA